MKPDKVTMKEVKDRADERFIAEERKAAEALQEKKSTIDETPISFEEKRKSFEKGEKEEKIKEEKLKEKKEESKKEDLRRDSALFEGVSQGLVRLDAAFTAAPQVQGTKDILLHIHEHLKSIHIRLRLCMRLRVQPCSPAAAAVKRATYLCVQSLSQQSCSNVEREQSYQQHSAIGASW